MLTALPNPMNSIFSRRCTLLTLLTMLFAHTMLCGGQTILVDATPSHVVNTFNPLYALGSTVDRVPSNATDTFFQPDQIMRIAPHPAQNVSTSPFAWRW